MGQIERHHFAHISNPYAVRSDYSASTVVEWYGARLAIVGLNPSRVCCVPTLTQRAILPGSLNPLFDAYCCQYGYSYNKVP